MPLAALALAALNLILLLWLALRRASDTSSPAIDRLERELRDELGRQGHGTRGDLASFQQMLLAQGGELGRQQNEQIDALRRQLAAELTKTQQQQDAVLARFGQTLAEQLRVLAETQ